MAHSPLTPLRRDHVRFNERRLEYFHRQFSLCLFTLQLLLISIVVAYLLVPVELFDGLVATVVSYTLVMLAGGTLGALLWAVWQRRALSYVEAYEVSPRELHLLETPCYQKLERVQGGVFRYQFDRLRQQQRLTQARD